MIPPPFDLAEPGTFAFTARRAYEGRRINRFALALRDPASRAAFHADELAAMQRAGLTNDEIALVRSRDWTGLLRAGGHLQAILKLAATVGEDLWSIGAHTIGCDRDTLIAACPRQVTGLPETGW